MLIEAAKGGHTSVVQLLLDYPHSIMINSSLDTTSSMLMNQPQTARQSGQIATEFLLDDQSPDEVPTDLALNQQMLPKQTNQKSFIKKTRSIPNFADVPISSAEAQPIRTQSLRAPKNLSGESNILEKDIATQTSISEQNVDEFTTTPFSMSKVANVTNYDNRNIHRHEQILHKQQILEELQVSYNEHIFKIFIL